MSLPTCSQKLDTLITTTILFSPTKIDAVHTAIDGLKSGHILVGSDATYHSGITLEPNTTYYGSLLLDLNIDGYSSGDVISAENIICDSVTFVHPGRLDLDFLLTLYAAKLNMNSYDYFNAQSERSAYSELDAEYVERVHRQIEERNTYVVEEICDEFDPRTINALRNAFACNGAVHAMIATEIMGMDSDMDKYAVPIDGVSLSGADLYHYLLHSMNWAVRETIDPAFVEHYGDM